MIELTKQQLEDFKRYEEIKILMKELEAEAKDIAPRIMKLIPEGEEVAGQFGKFLVQIRPEWHYSSAVQTIEAQFKLAKERDIAEGTAEKVEKPILYYKTNTKEE